MTYKERLERGLSVLGFRLEPGITRKYTTWTKPGQANRIFVGKAGALRCGACATKSHSLGDPASQTRNYLAVLKAGDTAARCPACSCYFRPKQAEQASCDDCCKARLRTAAEMRCDNYRFAENPEL